MSDMAIVSSEFDEIFGELARLLNRLGFESFTAIQSIAIPKILKHNLDIVIAAPTGSGKTEAALLPILYSLSKNSYTSTYGIKIIYVTPLRALNRDIHGRIERIANLFSFSSNIWHGDTPSSTRKRILRFPPDILITTPESLQILLIKNDIRENLENLNTVIVDEVQELFGSERGAELAIALERIDSIVGRHVRRILISAPVGDIDAVARYFFASRRYDIASVTGVKKYLIDVVVTDDKYMEGMFSVEHVYDYICRNILLNTQDKQVLVFANTRTSAEELGFSLSKCLSNNVALHHGSLSRDIREVVEAMLRRGDLQVVVATSSLELGIDIGGIDLVLQYLSPRQAIKLIQRVGRAGHREVSTSRGVVVVPPMVTEIIESLVIARRASEGLLEVVNPHVEPLDVLVHQVVGLTLEKEGISLDEIYSIISRAAPYNNLTLSALEKVIEFANSLNLIKCEKGLCKSTKKGRLYYITTNMIPDTVHYTTRSIIEGKSVGLLDEEFALNCSEEDVVVLAGKLWRIVSVDIDKKEVLVAPVESSDLIVLPKWIGELIPVHRNVSREVCAFLRRFCTCENDICLNDLFNQYKVKKDLRDFLVKNREKLCKVYPRDDYLVIEINHLQEEGKTMITFYTCLGSKGSEAFSLLLSHSIRNILGFSSAYKSHQLGTVILINGLVDKNGITKLINSLYHVSQRLDLAREIIEKEIKNTTIFKHRLISIAKKMGVISSDVEASEIKRVVEGLMNLDLVVSETLREILTEKIDVDEMLKYLQNLATKKLKIKIVVRRRPSPYAEEISSLGVLRTLIKQSLIPKDVLVEIVKRRLLDKEIKALCTTCFYTWSFRLAQKVEECRNIFTCFVECPRCGSKAVTVIDNDEEIKLLKKGLDKVKRAVNDKPKLLTIEKEALDKHRKLVDFIMSHGVAGLIALQGIGIGVETAKRVLAKSHDLNSLILNIIEQEKVFLRTWKYWKK
jgi:ATP-dependent Lhr-like helicase